MQEIVSRALAQDVALREVHQGYLYDFILTVEKLDGAGRVTNSHKTETTMRTQKEISYEVETIEDPAARKRVHKAQKTMAVMNLKKLAPRFELSLAGEETIQDIPCYKVHFAPKKNQPYDSREEKVVNALEGDFWIAQDSSNIIRSQGNLHHPVEIAWFFATMKKLNFEYVTQQISGEPFPARFNLSYDVQAAMVLVRRHEISEMKNYRSEVLLKHSSGGN